MKTLGALLVTMLLVSIATCMIAGGLTSALFMPVDCAIVGFGVAAAGCMIGALAMDLLVGVAPDVGVDVMTDVYRARNWWRRRSWRPFAAALAGQSTAASFAPPAYR